MNIASFGIFHLSLCFVIVYIAPVLFTLKILKNSKNCLILEICLIMYICSSIIIIGHTVTVGNDELFTIWSLK